MHTAGGWRFRCSHLGAHRASEFRMPLEPLKDARRILTGPICPELFDPNRTVVACEPPRPGNVDFKLVSRSTGVANHWYAPHSNIFLSSPWRFEVAYPTLLLSLRIPWRVKIFIMIVLLSYPIPTLQCPLTVYVLDLHHFHRVSYAIVDSDPCPLCEKSD